MATDSELLNNVNKALTDEIVEPSCHDINRGREWAVD